MLENQVDAGIKCLRFDRGGEFISNEFEIFYEKCGLRRHLSAMENSSIEWCGVMPTKIP